MQQYPGYPQPAPAPTKPAHNNLLWLAFASLLCWCVAPISLILGLLARNEAVKQASPVPTHARLAIILGSVGTAILVAAAGTDAATSLFPPKPTASPSTMPGATVTTAVSAQPSADAEQADRARQARAAAAVAAKEITRDRARLDRSMTTIDAALAAHQVGTARRTVDGLSGRFASLDSADLEPDEKADAETRGALSTASDLLSRYQQLKRAVDASEMLAFDAAFNTLWDPKNAQKDEDQLYANVGKNYGLTGPEVQAIYRRNEAEADRRLKARSEAEARALNPRRR
jgi:hypothetical protein